MKEEDKELGKQRRALSENGMRKIRAAILMSGTPLTDIAKSMGLSKQSLSNKLSRGSLTFYDAVKICACCRLDLFIAMKDDDKNQIHFDENDLDDGNGQQEED